MKDLIQRAKLRLLQMHFEAGVGHIGGNLSCLDALMVLFHEVLTPDDVFLLSKGHAAGALYVTLWSKGLLSDDDLKTFHQDGTRLAGHPIPLGGIPQIPFATGSLGHGLPVAAGWALGKKLRGEPGRVFVLMSDGEWQEGSNWEAVQFTQRQRLTNLKAITDENDLQGLGAHLDGIQDRPRPPYTTCCNGHDLDYVRMAMTGDWPFIGLWTTKGHGVSFMENDYTWHYRPMTPAQYAQARAEVEAE